MVDETVLLPEITTSCRDCIFAEYKVDPENSVMMDQMDCKLNRIHKFENKELRTEENDGINYNFYQINGRICNAARDSKWKDKFEDQSDDKLKNAVYQEVRIDYDLVINIPDFASNINSLTECVEFCSQLEVTPKTILLIHHQDSKLNNIDIFRATRKASIRDKISVETVYDYNSRENKMNKAVSRCKSSYFVWIENFAPFLNDKQVNRLNDYVNIKMGRFILVEDDVKNFLFCHTEAFKKVGGNDKISAVDKLKRLAKEQNSEYLIKKFSEL